jgi:hypothetical protein
MAESPSHKFGQVVGNLLEAVVRPFLEEFCESQGFYLDHQKRERPARKGKKVTWEDPYGNSHDLDYVIERDGTDSVIGSPVAFIETAWRRYTKHSRNKAQEIQGAILPLAEKYKWNNPFLGAVLAGVYTEGSLQQLRSQGFNVLYFPYETLVDAFSRERINIRFDESTPDADFRNCVEQIERTSTETMERIKRNLVEMNCAHIKDFFDSLQSRLVRIVAKVIVIPLYGTPNEFATLEAAFEFLRGHVVREGSETFHRYEVHVSFSNGDKIDEVFASKEKTREFLEYIAAQ